MIQRILFLICLACLSLVGCSAEGEMVAETAPTPTQLLATETPIATETTQPTPTPSPTPAPATHTPTPPPSSTPAPTATATATAQPTPTPTDTPIPLPPPPGEIYFFLDPDPPINNNSLDWRPPNTYNLYRASPGTTANEWQIETIWIETTLAGSSITVSPDKTKLALLLLEDTNVDGQLNDNPGGDIRNIYIYDRLDNSMKRLTHNQYNSFSVSWLPDSQAVTYPQSKDVFTTYLRGVHNYQENTALI